MVLAESFSQSPAGWFISIMAVAIFGTIGYMYRQLSIWRKSVDSALVEQTRALSLVVADAGRFDSDLGKIGKATHAMEVATAVLRQRIDDGERAAHLEHNDLRREMRGKHGPAADGG